MFPAFAVSAQAMSTQAPWQPTAAMLQKHVSAAANAMPVPGIDRWAKPESIPGAAASSTGPCGVPVQIHRLPLDKIKAGELH